MNAGVIIAGEESTVISRPHRLTIRPLLEGSGIVRRIEIRDQITGSYVISCVSDSSGLFEFTALPPQEFGNPYYVLCLDDSGEYNVMAMDDVYQVDDLGEVVIGGEKKFLHFDFSGWPYYSDEQETSIVQGTITDHEGLPCAREVRVYNRVTGERVGRATSDAETGVYAVKVPKGIEVDRIVLADDSLEILYNDLIDRILIGP